jgi:hypothetical protein
VSWLKDLVDSELGEMQSASLWHYTDATGLMGIIESDQLWATGSRFLNDATETSQGIGVFRKAMQEAVDGQQVAGHTREWLGRLLAGPQDGRGMWEWLDANLSLYVTCFCEKADLLSQWRGYGSHGTGNGYAIGFEPPRDNPHAWIQTVRDRSGYDISIRRVEYSEDRQLDLCRDLLARLTSFLDSNNTEAGRDEFTVALVDGLVQVASFFKHPSFQEEQEWRVIYSRVNDANALPRHFRDGSGVPVPYVRLSLPAPVGAHEGRLPIARIQIGPGAPDRAERGVRELLEEHRRDLVQVDRSAVPLR